MKKSKSRRNAKKSSIIVNTRWKLSHHKHSGKQLPHAHTSYPILVMILLCAGVLMAGWTRYVEADQGQYTVQASVPGDPPTTAATISRPTDDETLQQSTVTVTGTCPSNTYVQLLRNGLASGTDLCSQSGTYRIQTSVTAGSTKFIAQVFNFGNRPGPESDPVTVKYNPPVATSNAMKPTATSSAGASQSSAGTSAAASQPVEPLILQADNVFQGYYVGETASRQLTVRGGVAPYSVHVDWGDGTDKTYNIDQSKSWTVEHVYTKPGGYKGGYKTVATARDNTGDSTLLQLLAIINLKPQAGAAAASTTGDGIASAQPTGTGQGSLPMTKYVWTTYGAVSLMVASFWLGELREVGLAKSHIPIRRR